MRHKNRSFIPAKRIKLIIYFLLGNCIKRSCRLIKNHYVGIGIKRTRYRKLLPLSYRQFNTVIFKITHKRCIILFRQLFDKYIRSALLSRATYHFRVHIGSYISECNIFSRINRILSKILKNNAVYTIQFFGVIFPDIMSVKQYHSFCRIVQSGNQLYKRSFSRSVKPDKNNGITRFYNKIYIFNNIPFCIRIPK